MPDGRRHRALRSRRGITREQQDELAAKSNERAANAIKEGRLADEIVPVARPAAQGRPDPRRDRRGRPPRHHDGERSARCSPAFDKDGTITAGNASQISDGAAPIVADVASRGRAPRRHAARRARVATAWSPAPTRLAAHQPSRAIKQALEKAGIAVADVDLFEINEAFAAVGIARCADLGISDDIVNVNGGAIALGHPIGMSGNRLALTLLHELRRRGGGLGAAALCGGGGQGDAAIVRTV